MVEFKLRNLIVMSYGHGFTLWYYKMPVGEKTGEALKSGFFNDMAPSRKTPVSDVCTFRLGDVVYVSDGFNTAVRSVWQLDPVVKLRKLI